MLVTITFSARSICKLLQSQSLKIYVYQEKRNTSQFQLPRGRHGLHMFTRRDGPSQASHLNFTVPISVIVVSGRRFITLNIHLWRRSLVTSSQPRHISNDHDQGCSCYWSRPRRPHHGAYPAQGRIRRPGPHTRQITRRRMGPRPNLPRIDHQQVRTPTPPLSATH